MLKAETSNPAKLTLIASIYFPTLPASVFLPSTQKQAEMMVSSRRPETHQKPLQIINDDKFFTRILSKESSVSTPSFRIYYGVAAAGAVPFHWESRPGTPKHPTTPSTLPPLTPPPSYYSISPNNPSKSPKSKLKINSLLPRLHLYKKPQSPSPSQQSFSSTSSSASSRSHRRGHSSSPLSSFSSNSKSGDEGFDEGLSPPSTLSVGQRRRAGGNSGCYSMFVMKNVLLSIVGHGSA